jgi:hypothetical protein
MSIRTAILGPVAAVTLVAGLGVAGHAAAAVPGPVGPDDITACQELEITPGDDCPDKPKPDKPDVDPEPDPKPDKPRADDAPRPGRPSFTG